MGKTAFIDPAAVDAWDLWFRWREGTHLRDLTIDSTWDRVAQAISRAEPADAAIWAQRYADAFSKWQLLPNERLLRDAGTGTSVDKRTTRHPSLNAAALNLAALNVTAFVHRPRGAAAHFDLDEFIRVCGLAVRFLDNALRLAGHDASGLQIGVFGMADALSALGMSYAGEAACAQAREIAAAFAEGCLRGDSILARERGANFVDAKRWGARLRARGFHGELLADVRRYGMRYSRLTAIVPHPRLALLANNVADGLDPATRMNTQSWPAAVHWQDPTLQRGSSVLAQTAQLKLRAAMQPWIDRPIDTPLLALDPPNDGIRAYCAMLADEYGMRTPRWRLPVH
jgi:ribonucleoside-diphosphate reductase alpha chain